MTILVIFVILLIPVPLALWFAERKGAFRDSGYWVIPLITAGLIALVCGWFVIGDARAEADRVNTMNALEEQYPGLQAVDIRDVEATNSPEDLIFIFEGKSCIADLVDDQFLRDVNCTIIDNGVANVDDLRNEIEQNTEVSVPG